MFGKRTVRAATTGIILSCGIAPAVMGPSADAASVLAGPTKIGKDAVNRAFKKAGLSSPFGRHPEVVPIQIDGKYVYILDLIPGRVTNNFHAKWKGTRTFKVYAEGLPLSLRMKAAFQRKGDKQHWEDSNRGNQFKIGDMIVIDGDHNYFAPRNFSWGDSQEQEFPDGMIILAEEGLSLEVIYKHFGG